MTYRQTLTLATVGLAAAFLLATMIPFTKSLTPSEKAVAIESAASAPPIPDLMPGEVRQLQLSESSIRNLVSGGWSPVLGIRLLLIRDYDGEFYSYELPTWEGAVAMPSSYWGAFGEGSCDDFGPTLNNAYSAPS